MYVKKSSCYLPFPFWPDAYQFAPSLDYTVSWTLQTLRGARDTSRNKPPRWCLLSRELLLLFSFTFQLHVLEDKQKIRHRYRKPKIVLQIRAILINGTRGTQIWSTSNLQLFATGINGHQGFSRIKDTKKGSKILSRKPLFPLHSNSSKFLSLQVGYVRAREGGALPCLLGQKNTEPRAFEVARHWVADF